MEEVEQIAEQLSTLPKVIQQRSKKAKLKVLISQQPCAIAYIGHLADFPLT